VSERNDRRECSEATAGSRRTTEGTAGSKTVSSPKKGCGVTRDLQSKLLEYHDKMFSQPFKNPYVHTVITVNTDENFRDDVDVFLKIKHDIDRMIF